MAWPTLQIWKIIHIRNEILQGWGNAQPDKAFSDFLKSLRGEQSYASLASKLGIAESTLYRLTNRQQSATLRKIEKILRSQDLSLADVFGEEVSKKRGRRS